MSGLYINPNREVGIKTLYLSSGLALLDSLDVC